jgi:hypothetical protein
MRNKKLCGKYSVWELLKELAIMKISYLENMDSVKNEILKKQSTIFKAFDIFTYTASLLTFFLQFRVGLKM